VVKWRRRKVVFLVMTGGVREQRGSFHRDDPWK
jgi:hypothetical protein